MEKQVLSREQMQVLIDMGIDVSNASMCFIIYEDGDYEVGTEDLAATLSLDYTIEKTTPTFTLQDILEMLPDSILGSTKQIKTVEFKLSTRGSKVYYIQDNFNQQWLKCTNGNTLLEAAFNMLKWCKENKYI